MTGGGKILTGVILALVLAVNSAATKADTGLGLLEQLNEFPHARLLDLAQEDVLDYEVGLGAIQKIGGAWRTGSPAAIRSAIRAERDRR